MGATLKATETDPAWLASGRGMPSLRLRPGRPDDAAECGAICYQAFKKIAERHGFPPDFPSVEVAQNLLSNLLAGPAAQSAVAELDGRIVGSNFLWTTSSVAGVGPITIDPTVQNSAIGQQLMKWALDKARKKRAASVRLVQAAYHNRSMSLYTKVGFVVREPLSVLQGPAFEARIPGYEVRPAAGTDIKACARLHLQLHGYTREQELREAVAQATAMVVMHDDRVTGYATQIGFFGHAIGESNNDLKVLLGASPTFTGPGFLLPTRNTQLLRWCLEQGLKIVQPMTLMSHGFYNKPAGAYIPSILY